MYVNDNHNTGSTIYIVHEYITSLLYIADRAAPPSEITIRMCVFVYVCVCVCDQDLPHIDTYKGHLIYV